MTIRRQQDTTDLADAVDLVVVVGGRNSANTKELTRLVGIVGKPAVQIEHARDLEDPSVFEQHALIGVTGGTSTPIEDLEAVAARIYEIAGTPEVQADATARAHAAVTEVAEAPYRTSSLSAA